MKLIEAYACLKRLEAPIFTTNDAASLLSISNNYANKILNRLTHANLLIHIHYNLWGFSDCIEPLMIPDYLTAPLPSYISLLTALYYHGMISQIPEVIYAVSLARTKIYKTPLGSYSIHHITPPLFLGYHYHGEYRIPVATPEKALFDVFYLKPAKSRWFSSLPELTAPENFDWQKLYEYAKAVPSDQRRRMVLRAIQAYA